MYFIYIAGDLSISWGENQSTIIVQLKKKSMTLITLFYYFIWVFTYYYYYTDDQVPLCLALSLVSRIVYLASGQNLTCRLIAEIYLTNILVVMALIVISLANNLI